MYHLISDMATVSISDMPKYAKPFLIIKSGGMGSFFEMIIHDKILLEHVIVWGL